MTSDQLWQSIIGELELVISKANFTTWFKDTSIATVQGEQIIIGVPNSFTESWLKKKYHDQIVKAVRHATNSKYKDVCYKVNAQKTNPFIVDGMEGQTLPETVVKEEKQGEKPLTDTKENRVTVSFSSFNLNPKYTFSNFIVGKANELAHAACQAVAKNPGTLYNPLFIYGGVGLGKTHLIQATGNEIYKNYPSAKILYITSEKFTNDFVQAIKNNSMEKFKSIYRAVDVLLVDDIQFMSGKEQTQEEFFHTFNALYQNNKQIIISSDRPPKAIPSLEQRLISRFASGMIADISQPDLETRTAILEAKCKERDYPLNQDVVNYLATHIQNNVRELEGALNKVIAVHQLSNTSATIDSVQQVIASLNLNPHQNALTAKHIINTTSSYFDIPIVDLVGTSRKKDLVTPRQIIMYIMRIKMKSSFPTIGDELGGRDHTTAMHAFNKICQEMTVDTKLKQDIESIISRL
ncbi:MAG: chromosomal replication initiator protein DnaA [bacterium]